MENLNDLYILKPSNVWDTRAPLYYFIQKNKHENRMFWSMYLMANTFVLRSKGLGEKIFELENIRGGKNCFSNLEKSFNKDQNNKVIPLTEEKILQTLQQSVDYVIEQAIISYIGEFEAFINCWSINYLLAKLESNDPEKLKFKSIQIELINKINSQDRLPIFPSVYNAIPEINMVLKATPHVENNPIKKSVYSQPIKNNFTAHEVISMWKDWRNQLVHSGGIVDERFYEKHINTWEGIINSGFTYIKKFRLGEPLHLSHSLFIAMTSAISNATKKLGFMLANFSQEKRGHFNAPSARNNTNIVSGSIPPRLFLDCDHALSLEMNKRKYT